jgi:hypothetical protein
VPWLQTPTIFDIRTRPRSISSITGTKDLQMVNITLRVLSKPNVDMLPEIYKVRHPSVPQPRRSVREGRESPVAGARADLLSQALPILCRVCA